MGFYTSAVVAVGTIREDSLQEMDRCAVSLTLLLSFVFELVLVVCQSVLMQKKLAQYVAALHIKCNELKTIVGHLKGQRVPKFYVKGCALRLNPTVKQQRFNVLKMLHKKLYTQPRFQFLSYMCYVCT